MGDRRGGWKTLTALTFTSAQDKLLDMDAVVQSLSRVSSIVDACGQQECEILRFTPGPDENPRHQTIHRSSERQKDQHGCSRCFQILLEIQIEAHLICRQVDTRFVW